MESEEIEARLAATLKELETRILSQVAEAFRAGFKAGYWSPGGPRDGDGTDDSFDSIRAAEFLETEVSKIKDEDLTGRLKSK